MSDRDFEIYVNIKVEHDGFQTDSRSSPSEENFVGDVGRELGNRMNKTKEKNDFIGTIVRGVQDGTR